MTRRRGFGLGRPTPGSSERRCITPLGYAAFTQWYETGIFLAAALVLAGFCFWWIGRRRLSI